MSQENVEIVQSFYRATDPWPFFDLLDEDVQVDFSTHPLPDFPVFVEGKDAAINWWRHYWGTWDEYVLEPAEIIDAGQDRVLVVQDERGIGRGSGAPFERRWAVLYTMRDAKIVRIEHFSERTDALEAAGLTE